MGLVDTIEIDYYIFYAFTSIKLTIIEKLVFISFGRRKIGLHRKYLRAPNQCYCTDVIMLLESILMFWRPILADIKW